MTATLALLAGLAVGALGVWLVLRSVLAANDAELRRLREADRQLAAASAEVEAERRARAEQERLAARAEDAFRALAAEALQHNNTSFLELARTQLERFQTGACEDLERRQQAVEQIVKPVHESLEKVGAEVKLLEQVRRQDYGKLGEQLRTVSETQERLRAETGSLVTALRAPSVRGRWGEMQLRRAVELAGMLDHCDFVEQKTVSADDRVLRPDLVVRLPGGRNVVVDVKAPCQALLDALEAPDEATREARRQDYARHVRDHMTKLNAKAYWQQFSPAPDFVLMFLPGESFYQAALELDRSLLEHPRVMLVGPSNLIALLRAIAVGWREERVAESARAVSELGRELYERLSVMTSHFETLGKRLDGAVQAYNQSVGSLERRVLVSARRFLDHGIGTDRTLAEPVAIERSAQPPQTVELPARTEARELPAVVADADAA